MKLTTKSNYRVVVEPVTHIYGLKLSEDAVQSSIKEIKEQIKRHVDSVGYVGIEYETNHTCSHCGRTWEVSEDDSDPDFPKGTPVCCQDAIDEFKQSKVSS